MAPGKSFELCLEVEDRNFRLNETNFSTPPNFVQTWLTSRVKKCCQMSKRTPAIEVRRKSGNECKKFVRFLPFWPTRGDFWRYEGSPCQKHDFGWAHGPQILEKCLQSSPKKRHRWLSIKMMHRSFTNFTSNFNKAYQMYPRPIQDE